MDSDQIFLTEKDYIRIKSLFEHFSNLDFDKENLEIELDRARILADNEVPKDLVTMNSTLKYKKLRTKEEKVITLVYPSQLSKIENGVSILSPLGTALIGLSAGQEINWAFPNGKTERIKIIEIIYQPEASGDWQL